MPAFALEFLDVAALLVRNGQIGTVVSLARRLGDGRMSAVPRVSESC